MPVKIFNYLKQNKIGERVLCFIYIFFTYSSWKSNKLAYYLVMDFIWHVLEKIKRTKWMRIANK